MAAASIPVAALAALVTRGLAAGCASLAETLLAATTARSSSSGSARSRRRARAPSTRPTRGCAGSSATCTTARSTGSPTSRWSSAARARKLATDPDPVDALLADAHDESKVAMRELRDLVRGIHPSVLSDRGLDAALSGLAERASVPVEIRGSLADRLPPAVETAAYYVVAETLTNVGRHSGATSAHVDLRRDGDELVLAIGDDGHGGARRVPGSGLEGLAQRVEALDGKLEVDSPAGRTHHDHRAVAMRVVIAEDLVLLREGLASLLADSGHEVVAGVGDGDALLRALDEHRPDLAIVDVRMPPTQTDEGVRAAVEARRRRPDAAILILSQYVEERYASDLLSSGARGIGYLLKDRVADVQEFVAAAVRVAAGGTVIDPEVVAQLIGRRQRPVDALTPRETEVLSLMAEGHSNAAIVERLEISQSAVEKHVRKVFTKLGLPETDQHHRRVLAVLTYLGV